MAPQIEEEIKALINLLDDPDESIYHQIRDRLVSYGEIVIPKLENVWEENSFGVVFQDRIEDIIHKIQFDAVVAELRDWKNSEERNLLEAALIINRYQYPDLNEEKIKSQIEQIKQDVWIELNDNLTSFEQIKVINHILFEVHGFSGNTVNYHAPQNSYLNNVLESKKGNPLSLSIIYMIIAQQVNLPVYGVNLPNHFVLAYIDENNILKFTEAFTGEKPENDDNVLFYVNPFSRGTIFNKKEIETFLKQLNLSPKDAFFKPCTNLDIVQRMITNLIYSYEKLGYPDKIEELKELLKSLS